MRTFNNIAKVIGDARYYLYTQKELAHLMGYKNGQFVSNVERGLCGIPANIIPEVAIILEIDSSVIVKAMVNDYKEYLNNCVKENTPKTRIPSLRKMDTL